MLPLPQPGDGPRWLSHSGSLAVKLDDEYCDEPVRVKIAAEGECQVTAGSISGSSEVEVLDPGMHIATLAEGAKLSMELVLQKGPGYVCSHPIVS